MFKLDKELDKYRNIMTPPAVYADGFSWKTVIGAFFLGLVLMPASQYLSLVIGGGGGIGDAGRWITIIIFTEIARRSLKELKMQEIFILYYMAGMAMGSPFTGLLWNQYLVQADYARGMGVASEIPAWVAPQAEQIQAVGRTFLNRIWLAPILLTSMGLITGSIDSYGLGYVLYRITNDVEELPFPMAPVGASGIVALTESKDERERWRWRCFSIGGILGMLWGALYVGVPAISGAILAKPLQLIPIPFIDYTQAITKWFPATPMNLVIDLGTFLGGTVIPFWAAIGGAFGIVFTLIANPLLYKYGILSQWDPQMDLINTQFVNGMDFYMSFGIGLTIAISLIGLLQVVWDPVKAMLSGGRHTASDGVPKKKDPSRWRKLLVNDPKRGDFSIWIAIAIYVVNTALWIWLSAWLVPGFPWPFFVFYAVVYTPLISYATAKLEGICGQAVSLPMIREATYILSGYRGIAIWFAPAPLGNYGTATVSFRTMELTGTKIISKIKTQLVTLPICVIGSIITAQVLWSMAPIPSAAYPFAEKMWELNVKNQCLMLSSTMEGGSAFMDSWKTKYVVAGAVSGVGFFALLSSLGLPVLLVFGLVRGLGENTPGALIFQLLGALVGRFYFRKRFGEDTWLKYAPVLMAGYVCGMGLVGMVSVSFTILTKMMTPLIY